MTTTVPSPRISEIESSTRRVEPAGRPSASKRRRTVAAILLGLTAVATALLAARGPAVADRATYEWPPKHLPAATPTRSWMTPLLLARHYPASLDARVPCGPARSLSGDASPTVLLATMRDPARSNGLEVLRTVGGEIVVTIGRSGLGTFARVGSPAGCVLDINVVGRTWTVGRPGHAPRRGVLAAPPAVAGLITNLDLRTHPKLEVTVRPIPQDTHPSELQTLMRLTTAVLLAAAVLLLLPTRRPVLSRPRLRALTLPDGFVAVSLLMWLVLEPVLFDDGWVRARQTNALLSGGFSNYYDQYGGNLPLLTWLEWLQQFVVAHSTALAVGRLPSVVALVGIWLICGSCLARLIGKAPRRGDAPWWSAAITFVVGAAAFGITLRPEPFIALLVVGVFACCQRYLESPSATPLIIAVFLVALAVTAHPAGAVASAPMLICLPRIWRDSRTESFRRLDLAAILVIGCAWTVLLAFLDSDTLSKRESVTLTRLGGEHGAGVLQELDRYRNLTAWGSPVLKREFIALLLLAAIGLVASRFWKALLPESLPSASILIGLGLLAFSPSKWVHHFGVFIGLAVVAIGVESHRLRAAHRSTARLFSTLGLFLCLTAWATSVSTAWGPLDAIDWGTVPFLATVVMAGATVALVAVTRRSRRVATLVIPVVLITTLSLSASILALGSIIVDRWSPAKQVLGELAGHDSCGLANDLSIPDLASLRPLVPADPNAEVSRAQDQVLLPLEDTPRREVWYRAPTGSLGVVISGRWAATDELRVVWGVRLSGGIRPLRSGPANLEQSSAGPDRVSRRFVAEWSLPKRPPGANVVAISVGPRNNRGATVSSPVAYREIALTSVLSGRRAREALVSPYLFAAMPCARLPRLAHGTADVPGVIIEASYPPFVSGLTSPFMGLGETMGLWRVPLRPRAKGWANAVNIYLVSADPRDAIVPPVMRTRS